VSGVPGAYFALRHGFAQHKTPTPSDVGVLYVIYHHNQAPAARLEHATPCSAISGSVFPFFPATQIWTFSTIIQVFSHI